MTDIQYTDSHHNSTQTTNTFVDTQCRATLNQAGQPADRRKAFETPEQAKRRKDAREVGAFWTDLVTAAGLTPIEVRTAHAIEVRIDEMGRGPDSKRWVTNAAIGVGLVSSTKDIEHAKRTARNRVGHLFNKAIPRSGYQILTRYKVGDDEQRPCEFVSHAWPVAAFFSELLAEEFKTIENRIKDREKRAAAKAEARQRLIAEALTYLPKCEAAILEPDGETVYAYVSGPEAKAYCESKPEYKARPYEYRKPEAKKPKKPFYSDDFDRLKKRAVKEAVDLILDAIGERNGKDTARAFWHQELFPALEHAGERWVNYCHVADDEEREREKENLPTAENPVLPPDQMPHVAGANIAGGGEEKVSSPTTDKPTEDNDLETALFDAADSQASAECDRERRTGADVGYYGPGAYMVDQGADSLPCERLEKLDNLAGPDLGDLGTGAILQNGVDQDHLGEFGNVAALELETNPPVELEGSINFNSALDAALAYVADGWAVLPCCQFNPVTGRCTEPRHNPTGTPDADICKGKVPLLAGRKDAKPGDGYTAASRDKGLITEWFTKKFKNAGVAIRLDNIYLGDCVLLDVDVKDGKPGLASYDELDATFDLPATLTALTPSGGRHYIFQLPEGLPAGYLGSWGEILPGLDLKVGRKGLEHTEPTVGKTGVYRWVDPTADVAELPRKCCEYLHDIHERKEQAKLEKSRARTEAAGFPADSSPFNPEDDQGKYFKDAGAGERRPRLRTIACSLAARGANENQIVDVLKYHDGRFSQPTNDIDFMLHVAAGAVSKFGQGVAQ